MKTYQTLIATTTSPQLAENKVARATLGTWVLLALCLVMGACGSSDDTDDTTPRKDQSDTNTPTDKDQTFTVTFDLDGGRSGATTQPQLIVGGQKVAKPTDPTKSGYVFDGWYDAKTNGNKFDFGTTTVTKDMKIYARWTPVHTVIFDLDGGTGDATNQSVVDGQKATRPPADPTRDGDIFDGWYDAKTGGHKFDFGTTTVTKDMTIYARWTPVHTVTFDLDGGTGTADNQSVDDGQKATKPTTDPTRDGYVFDDWYDAKTGGNKFAFGTKTIAADTKLYARWRPAYSITFGGTEYVGIADDTNQTILVNIGTVYKKINGETVTLVVTDSTGKTVENKSVTLIQAKGVIGVTRDGKLYTVLKLFVKPTTKAELKAIVDTAINTNAEGDTANLNFVDTSLIKDMSNLFSKKKTFNGNLSEWDTSNVTTMRGMFYEAHAFNQDIGNWDTSNVTNMSYMFGFTDAFNQYIGNWDTSNVTDMSNMFQSAIKFNKDISMKTNPDGSKSWDTGKVTHMTGMFSVASAFNKDIGNWNTANVTDMGAMFHNASVFNQDLSNWNVAKVTDHGSMFVGSAMETETGKQPTFIYVTFNLNYEGATGAPDPQKPPRAVKPTDPTRAGYTFDGWYETPDGSGTAFTFGLFSADVNLYAKWKSN